MTNPYYGYDYFYQSGLGIGACLFSIAISILSIVALWMIFQKANEEGWAAIVPFYNLFVLYKITWGNGWFFLLLLIPIANLIIAIITMVKLAKAFGKGGGFACGLIFLNVIFYCILAFSKDIVYVGIDGQGGGNNAGTGGAPGGGFQSPYSQQNAQKATQQSAQNESYFYQQPDAPSGPKYCPKCGAALEPGTKFCPSCGQSL